MEYETMINLFVKLEGFIKQNPHLFGTRQRLVDHKLARNYEEAQMLIRTYCQYARDKTTIDRLVLKIFLIRYEQSNIVIENLYGTRMHILDIINYYCSNKTPNAHNKVCALERFIQNRL